MTGGAGMRWLEFAPCCATLLSIILATACGTVEETRVPAELKQVNSTLSVEDKWHQSAGSGVDERYLKLKPALARGRIYVVDAKGTVSALRLGDGEPIWQVASDDGVIAGLQRGDGLLFLGTEDGAAIALRQRGGTEFWRKQLGAEVVALSEPDLGVIVVRTADSRLHGLDVASGEILWQTVRTTPVLNLRGASRPLMDSGRVVVGFDDGKLVAVSADRGNVLWTTTISNPTGSSELERLTDIDGEIKVLDGIVYVASFQGSVAAVTLSEGRTLWSREISSHMGLDVDAENVYVTDADSYIWALERISGATLWKQDNLEYREVTAPVAIDDYVLVGDLEGYVHWLSKYDGRFVARTTIASAGILSTPVVTNETAYVLDRGGVIAALQSEQQQSQPPADDSRGEKDGLEALELEPFPEEGASSPP
ncbi:MAG: outer membrane protein assembly factor BamB [Gammaproteobacteria bacterium]